MVASSMPAPAPPSQGPASPPAPRPGPAPSAWPALHGLLALWEGLWLAASVLLGHAIRATTLPPGVESRPMGPYALAAGLWAALGLGGLALGGGYRLEREGRPVDEAILGLLAGTMAAGGSALLAFAYRGFSFSRLAWGLAFLLAVLGLAGGRVAFARWRAQARAAAWGHSPALLVARPQEAEALSEALARQGLPLRLWAGSLPTGSQGAEGAQLAIRLADAAQAQGCRSVWVAWPGASAEAWAALAEGLAQAGLRLRLPPGPVADWLGQGQRAWLGPHLAAEVGQAPWARPAAVFWKRAMDLALAGPALLLVGPLLLLMMAAVRLSSPGPALYRQERLGQGGRPFTLLKLRTMPTDAEAEGPVWAAVGDERATPLGAWLRRSSLDELPQLWNVLRGDMSLVGPRPERPAFHERFCADLPDWPRRLAWRPGLTGWAQVHGLRGDVPLAQRLALDLAYLKGWSLALDWRILALTLGALWRSPGR